MKLRTPFYIEPEPHGDQLLALSKELKANGYSLKVGDADIDYRWAAKSVLLENGPTKTLSWGLVCEEVLPDKTPRDTVADTLRYKLSRCAPTSSLTIIDPYLYPDKADPRYANYFVKVFEATIKACSTLLVVTFSKRNSAVEAQLDAAVASLNPKMTINKKYSEVFHDRFWIVDDSRGLFVGTSLNGIGRRYAVIDYLSDDDTAQIVQRVRDIP